MLNHSPFSDAGEVSQAPAGTLILTRLRASPARPVAKTMRLDESGHIHKVQDYPRIRRWTRHTTEVPLTMAAFYHVLAKQIDRREECLVTGFPV